MHTGRFGFRRLSRCLHVGQMAPSVPEVPQREARLRICHLVVEVLKAINADLFGSGSNFGAELDTIAIGCTVLIGHAEGRPMTAHKLALYLGMPKSTVLRKLERLRAMEVVFEIDGRFFITAARLKANAPLVKRLGTMI